MNYEEMSDFEINKAVAEHFYDADWLDRHATHAGMIPDYCNNQSDAWPIIVENKISIVPTGGWWRARPEKTAWPEQFDDNPLRAAMIVFLMMKDSENV